MDWAFVVAQSHALIRISRIAHIAGRLHNTRQRGCEHGYYWGGAHSVDRGYQFPCCWVVGRRRCRPSAPAFPSLDPDSLRRHPRRTRALHRRSKESTTRDKSRGLNKDEEHREEQSKPSPMTMMCHRQSTSKRSASHSSLVTGSAVATTTGSAHNNKQVVVNL